MFNRLPLFQSTGDRALAAAHRLKLDLWRSEPDEDGPGKTTIEFELHGTLDASDSDSSSLITGLVNSLSGKAGGQ
jgi:hypothetical protein